MSDAEGGAGEREVAWRIFAAEYDDADHSYAESDEERAPNYVVTPTGARSNRVFVVGVLTEVETVSDDYLRARVVDPTGPFVIYAGQYQPEALAFLERATTPAFVAVTGKARTYQPDDSDRVFTSIRPERISEVDAATRDRWVVDTAEQTLERVEQISRAKASGLTGEGLREALEADDIESGLARGIPVALDHYGTTGSYLADVHEMAVGAARVVAGEQDEADAVESGPGEGTDEGIEALVPAPLEPATSAEPAAEPAASSADATDDPGSVVGSAQTADDGAAASTAEAPADGVENTSQHEPGSQSPNAEAAQDAETTESTEAATAGDADTGHETIDEGGSAASAADPSGTGDETDTESLEATSTTAEGEDADPGEFDGEFELDADEREAIEDEYGTEFQSGTDVDEPGTADIETPDPDEIGEPDADGSDASATRDSEAAEAAPTASEPADTPASDPPATDTTPDATSDAGETADAADSSATSSNPAPESGPDAETTADRGDPAIDLEDAVVETMETLDDGDGVERGTLIETVTAKRDADEAAVEDAIEDALMGGRCYEVDGDSLKSI
jgi:RPA family protein